MFEALIHHLSDLSPSFVVRAVTVHGFPVDSIALTFGALALGAAASGEIGHGRYYFKISTEMVKHFVGQSTMHLCLTYFLQHTFALRISTLNYAQGIIAQAVQSAHDLGLHHNTHGLHGLQLYLLIYMADQYCSLTHNTEPIIRISRSQGHIFGPLRQAKPQLRTLIDLVTINGYIIEHSHRLQDPSQTEILELESKIGGLGSQLMGADPMPSSCGGFRTTYEPLARVHMLCCRLKFRAPGLLKQENWLTSLSICVLAAENVLATYFQLHHPILTALVTRSNVQDPGISTLPKPTPCKLPVTWRQVKRIVMSSFVIVFAYFHGEMVHGEASRYIAMARLLLEYPRWRWGNKLDEALQTLADISSLAKFEIYDQMQMLLPGTNEQCLRRLCEVEVGLLSTPLSPTVNCARLCDEMTSLPSAWNNTFDTISMNGLLESDINTSQDESLFGLWETVECPVEDAFWSGSTK